jgi:hypothetical protein
MSVGEEVIYEISYKAWAAWLWGGSGKMSQWREKEKLSFSVKADKI